jgi:23S rRNA (uracil1939-C5)-methyltransferase
MEDRDLTGTEVELTVEKPAAGGRMIARHEGRIVLVLGAIPGERVVARIERVEKRLAFASTVRVLEPSSDRREPAGDPLCGGCVYSHIAYPRQIAIKAEVIADAFVRIGRVPVEAPITVAASPERGYRLRARLHVRGGRAGSYREGTHQLCDVAPTGQLLPDTIAAVDAALSAFAAVHVEASLIQISENIPGSERMLHVDLSFGSANAAAALEGAVAAASLTGCTARTVTGEFFGAGSPVVTDALSVLTAGRAREGTLSRSAESFFQANRFLLPALVTTVLDAVGAQPAGEILDLYAGVGLFSVALAACGHDRITAVEGDRHSGADLRRNTAPWPAVRPVIGRVEDHLGRRGGTPPATIIVDPPRTGISRETMEAVVRHGARRVIYISCDPPTMARDARRLLDGGYGLTSLTAFDFFPNTPHVESLGVFDH